MRILDLDGKELALEDAQAGHLAEEKILLKHHDAVEAVEEKGHWVTVAEYPNGGKDVEWEIDVPGVAAKEAWDEYEDILRFIPFTKAELAAVEIDKRKAQLEQTDYIAAKAMDGLLGCKTITEALAVLADMRKLYADVLSQRQRWRDEIGELEQEADG